MDCRTAWLSVIPRYTVHERAFVFQLYFFLPTTPKINIHPFQYTTHA